MSESKCEERPFACATAGMKSASGGGVFLGVLDTGATRLTEMFVVDFVVVSLGTNRRVTAEPPLNTTFTAPVFVPTSRLDATAVTVSVVPDAETTPVAGL